ncbi:uncharacterized protein LTR77_009598 [Saxophila tyrrhenica]|uniref:Fe2OG dioxygenase domain-containing protein n=1 Tax=Saxophila tyrrhenica TaxID=1690608 RepID=A0AAV9NZ21_9PEZI|nr:hypothetical protein LTR77_009598 [Saxophila tyrrhenica]
MASAFAELLSQSRAVQTRKGLILTGLQNDFLSPEGKLPVSTSTGFLDRLTELVKEFREHGDVIWVRSHFVENRAVNQDDESGDTVVVGNGVRDISQVDRRSTSSRASPARSKSNTKDDPPSPSKKARLSTETAGSPASSETDDVTAGSEEYSEPDEELFLTRTANRTPCCIPGSFGAEYAIQIKDLVDPRKDLQLIKTYYSAFSGTSLLMTLRIKFVTELYICGCTTNLSLFATAMDAARHGISITLVEDCLGYRKKDRHDEAIKQLREIMGARVITSKEIIKRLKNPAAESDEEDEDEESEVAVGEEAGKAAIDALAVDSDDEDQQDDLLAAPVRMPHLHGSTFAPAPSSSLSSLPAAASQTRSAPGTERREPPSTGAADASRGTSDGQRSAAATSRAPGSRRAETPYFGGWIGRATARRSSIEGVSESLEGVTAYERMVEEDKTKATDTEISRKQSAQQDSPTSVLDQDTSDQHEQAMEQAKPRDSDPTPHTQASKPLLGEDKQKESAGSRILYDLLPPELAETIFDALNNEITWQKMHHQTGEVPRLVCCQGSIGEDGSMPVYRHPSDQTLPTERWTLAVDQVRRAAEQVVGHALNHALIQLYRGGTDYISEHSDKTLDIAKGSSIVNISFGALRKMRLRTKRSAGRSSQTSSPPPVRTTYRIPMPHNSMITMSLPTNAEYLHGITADKRPDCELAPAETAFGGQRISLTFRNIATFLNADSSRIWGQGATAKDKESAKVVVNGDAEQSERLVKAFGKENAATSIAWESIYREGFDVLHLK